jgi:hypothetical protein
MIITFCLFMLPSPYHQLSFWFSDYQLFLLHLRLCQFNQGFGFNTQTTRARPVVVSVNAVLAGFGSDPRIPPTAPEELTG